MSDLAFTSAAELAAPGRATARCRPVELVDGGARPHRAVAADAQRLYHGLRRRGARRGAGGRGGGDARRRARAAARRAVRGQGPGQHRRGAHDVRLGGARRQCAGGGFALGGAAQGGRRDPRRQDDDPGIRPQMLYRRAAVRPHRQPVGSVAHLRRVERRRGGRGRGRAGADRHRHRRRRVEPHPGGVLRRRRLQADAGPGAARSDAGRVRQPVAHHADDPHGHGHRADAAGDGGPAPVRPAFARPRRRPISSPRRGAEGDLQGRAHRLAAASRQHHAVRPRCAPRASARLPRLPNSARSSSRSRTSSPAPSRSGWS